MNTGAKVTLIIGAVLTLIGAGLFIPAYLSGAKAVEEAENLDDEDLVNAALWSSSSSGDEIYLRGFQEFGVYVLGQTDAPAVEVFESGNTTNFFSACDESDVNGWDVMCAPIGNYRQIGAINLPNSMVDCITCTINVTGEGEVVVVDENILYAGVFGGFMDVLAASFAGCCALCFGIIMLIIGGCVAIFSDGGQAPTVVMAQPAAAFGAAPAAAPGAGPVVVSTPSPGVFAPAPTAGGVTLPQVLVAGNAPVAPPAVAPTPVPVDAGIVIPQPEDARPPSESIRPAGESAPFTAQEDD